MGWETRRNKTYYYSARKVDGRVVKTYHSNQFGTAACLHELALLEKRQADLARVLRQAEINDWNEMDAQVQAVCDQFGPLVEWVLTTAGYHRHNRGPPGKPVERNSATRSPGCLREVLSVRRLATRFWA